MAINGENLTLWEDALCQAVLYARLCLYIGFVNVLCRRLRRIEKPAGIEAPRSKLRGIFDRKELCRFQIRSLTPQQAAGNALAFAVQVTGSRAEDDRTATFTIKTPCIQIGFGPFFAEYIAIDYELVRSSEQ
jgi:hypothetical protein